MEASRRIDRSASSGRSGAPISSSSPPGGSPGAAVLPRRSAGAEAGRRVRRRAPRGRRGLPLRGLRAAAHHACLGVALRALGLLVAAGLVADAARAGPLAELRKEWTKLDADARAAAVDALSDEPTPSMVSQLASWLPDKEPRVRAALVRALLRCSKQPPLEASSVAAVDAYLGRWLKARADAEKSEFREVVRKFGKDLPPDDRIAAGRDWEDPWDETRRKLPAEAKAERAHALALVDAIERAEAKGLAPSLLRAFREHHDPEVLCRLARCFGAWKEWGALLEMADLARIQAEGRGVAGSAVVGEEAWSTMRLKWDVHKDRLWWSRPEYVPRVSRPVFEAATAIVGSPVASARELDRWILDHEKELAERGIRLDAAYRRRASETQR